MSEGQRKAQQAYFERLLDLIEDTSLSQEEIDARAPDIDLGIIGANDIIDAHRRRIARWEGPRARGRAPSTQDKLEDYERYLRLQRLVASLSKCMVMVVRTLEKDIQRDMERNN
jgi:GAF domain-containing protein